MHSIQSYLERRSTEELQGMLCSYCEGYADFGVETAMMICRMIAERDPKYIDPQEEFLHLYRMYLV